MKAKTIIGLILLVGFTTLLFLNFGQQVGGYMSFAQAAESGSKAHVVGTWLEDREASYNPSENVFVFYMQDDDGNVREVQYSNPKPANFEDAEKLVIEGRANGDVFHAENILVKCPSKYNAEAPTNLQPATS
ncbi:MAG: cytochrome c maturation protein CcmE [Rhodothermales bacterium]|nr:cytochrome c maturation protein CcmE [Rhodothermales bacterium]